MSRKLLLLQNGVDRNRGTTSASSTRKESDQACAGAMEAEYLAYVHKECGEKHIENAAAASEKWLTVLLLELEEVLRTLLQMLTDMEGPRQYCVNI